MGGWDVNVQPSPAPQSQPVVSGGGGSGKPRVCICIPHKTNVSLLWAQKTFYPLVNVGVDFCDKTNRLMRGLPLGVTRDELVKQALEDALVTHLLWVDTDMIPESPASANDALKILLSMDGDIVSGLYRAKQAIGFNYAAWVKAEGPGNDAGGVPMKSWSGNWLHVNAVGMGFCLVKRAVYEKLPKPWYPWNTPAPSEDFNFCVSARQHGYPINVCTDVKLSHIGEIMVNTDGSIKTPEL